MTTSALPLLQRLAKGDKSALSEIYDRYAGLVNGLAMRIVRDVAEAEDVVQEVFLQIWRQADRYDPSRGRPEAWLCAIARSRALDRLRRKVARREDNEESAPPSMSTPRTDEALIVRQALGGLSPEQRHAVELAYYGGLTQTEIAAALGEPLGTVKTRIRTALIRLRTTLGAQA